MFPQLFHRRSTENPQEKNTDFETFRTLMEARFDRLEQNFTALRTEWADVYDKIMHLYDRSRKRIKKAEDAVEREEPSLPISPPISKTDQRQNVLQQFRNSKGA